MTLSDQHWALLRSSAINDAVILVEQGQQFVDRLIDRVTGRDHQPNRSGRRQAGGQISQRGHAGRTALHAARHGGRIRVVGHDGVAAGQQALRHVAALATQPNDSHLHADYSDQAASTSCAMSSRRSCAGSR